MVEWFGRRTTTHARLRIADRVGRRERCRWCGAGHGHVLLPFVQRRHIRESRCADRSDDRNSIAGCGFIDTRRRCQTGRFFSRLKSSLTVFPGVVAALLPSVTCPLCWPAYAGLLSAMGMTFLFSEAYLLPLTAGLLVIAVVALWFGGKRRGDYKPFTAGLIGVAILLAGRFVVDSSVTLYLGAALLVGASFWNAWPRRSRSRCQGSACRS